MHGVYEMTMKYKGLGLYLTLTLTYPWIAVVYIANIFIGDCGD